MAAEVYLLADPLSNNPLVPAVYHTTICVDFKNDLKYLFSYNDKGLNLSPAGKMKPKRIHFLGKTDKTFAEATKHAYRLQSTKFKDYSAIATNCNHFCNDLSLLLCGEVIPLEYIMQCKNVLKDPRLLLGCLGSKC